MRRQSRWLALLLLIGGVFTCLGVLLYLVKREPAFYTATLPSPDWEDSLVKSASLATRIQDLKTEIRSKKEWGDKFSAADLNCFFAENLRPKGGLYDILPEKTHSPRLAIEGDRVKLGFRYGQGFWSTVVWIELRIWLVANERNLVGVEVCDLRAGRLPLGTQSILDSITESARESNIEVTWYRHGSNPVGLFRFFAGQAQATSQILTLMVTDGKIVVAGRSDLEPATVAATP